MAEEMDSCAQIQKRIETGVSVLSEAIAKRDLIQGAVFDELDELIDLTTEIVRVSTKVEYQKACERMSAPGGVQFVDDFLLLLGQVGLLNVAI